LWIGGIWSVKNPLQIIDIAKEVPDLNFLVVGSSRDPPLLKRFMEQKTTNVHYLGPVTDPLKTTLIRKCSVGLATSRRETFGWTPLEFLKEGKPVVCPPLRAFKEIYGDLLFYAHTTGEFVERMKELQENDFRTAFDEKAVLDLQRKYSFDKAADFIMRKLSAGQITILARDTSTRSDYVAGFFLVDWKLWKSMHDEGADLWIISDGTKYATEFGLSERIFLISSRLVSLREKTKELEQATRRLEILNRKLMRLALFVMEPLSYVYSYLRHPQRTSSEVILAEGRSQIAAAIILKLVFRLKTACLLHDDNFYLEIWEDNVPVLAKIFNAIFVRSLRNIDHLIVVSEMLRKEVLLFYPYPDRVTVMWG
jgi:hypothetical protein